MGPLAQRLERATHNRLVPGSNPGWPILENLLLASLQGTSIRRAYLGKNKPVRRRGIECNSGGQALNYIFSGCGLSGERSRLIIWCAKRHHRGFESLQPDFGKIWSFWQN
jgi:hypothetical protein